MKTKEEVLEEVVKLANQKDLDESGLVVRLITMTALSWVVGDCPVSPSERIKEITEELLEGVIDEERRQ